MQGGLNSVSMAVGVMEKALYSSYTHLPKPDEFGPSICCNTGSSNNRCTTILTASSFDLVILISTW
jgi:hypothetical protein